MIACRGVCSTCVCMCVCELCVCVCTLRALACARAHMYACALDRALCAVYVRIRVSAYTMRARNDKLNRGNPKHALNNQTTPSLPPIKIVACRSV